MSLRCPFSNIDWICGNQMVQSSWDIIGIPYLHKRSGYVECGLHSRGIANRKANISWEFYIKLVRSYITIDRQTIDWRCWGNTESLGLDNVRGNQSTISEAHSSVVPNCKWRCLGFNISIIEIQSKQTTYSWKSFVSSLFFKVSQWSRWTIIWKNNHFSHRWQLEVFSKWI